MDFTYSYRLQCSSHSIYLHITLLPLSLPPSLPLSLLPSLPPSCPPSILPSSLPHSLSLFVLRTYRSTVTCTCTCGGYGSNFLGSPSTVLGPAYLTTPTPTHIPDLIPDASPGSMTPTQVRYSTAFVCDRLVCCAVLYCAVLYCAVLF
jgi:hypothetical protein